ncbi:hypothetical protein SISSUDRAFT_634832 [Sistotremastrum suecicum HHB10207 ss-3]|uniref:Uncharacterized protein n=1 Tax=Sistotremastrum suecicum HHB10207 ss-3 TaxID=1314776 RepID=A0A166EDZ6_9AGAM|nr:hypothetical protein SISSUDRAFT_634832 [Sistotremastrum suecicum HHB10207 ss-3]
MSPQLSETSFSSWHFILVQPGAYSLYTPKPSSLAQRLSFTGIRRSTYSSLATQNTTAAATVASRSTNDSSANGCLHSKWPFARTGATAVGDNERSSTAQAVENTVLLFMILSPTRILCDRTTLVGRIVGILELSFFGCSLSSKSCCEFCWDLDLRASLGCAIHISKLNNLGDSIGSS